MNGMCAAGIYQTLGYDPVNSKARKDAACFMQRQLGYIFNHKCSSGTSSCNTKGPDGFSYMVGCAPARLAPVICAHACMRAFRIASSP